MSCIREQADTYASCRNNSDRFYARNRLHESIDKLESALAAEQEAHAATKQRAEAAEALIKASREQEPVAETGWLGTIHRWFNTKVPGGTMLYAQPPIPPGVAELQRQLEEARKVPEGWKLVPLMSTRTMGEAAAKLQADMYPEPPSFGEFYKAMLSAAPTRSRYERTALWSM